MNVNKDPFAKKRTGEAYVIKSVDASSACLKLIKRYPVKLDFYYGLPYADGPSNVRDIEL